MPAAAESEVGRSTSRSTGMSACLELHCAHTQAPQARQWWRQRCQSNFKEQNEHATDASSGVQCDVRRSPIFLEGVQVRKETVLQGLKSRALTVDRLPEFVLDTLSRKAQESVLLSSRQALPSPVACTFTSAGPTSSRHISFSIARRRVIQTMAHTNGASGRVLKRGDVIVRMVSVGDRVENIYGEGFVTQLQRGRVSVRCRQGGGIIQCRTMFNAGLRGAWEARTAELTAPSAATPFGTLMLQPRQLKAGEQGVNESTCGSGCSSFLGAFGMEIAGAMKDIEAQVGAVADVPDCWCADPSNHLGSCMRGQAGERGNSLRIAAPNCSTELMLACEDATEKSAWLRLLRAVAHQREAFASFVARKEQSAPGSTAGQEEQLLLCWGAMGASEKRLYERQAAAAREAAEERSRASEVVAAKARRQASLDARAVQAVAMGTHLAAETAAQPHSVTAAATTFFKLDEDAVAISAQRAFVQTLRGKGLAVEKKPANVKAKIATRRLKLVDKKGRLCFCIGHKVIPLADVVDVACVADDVAATSPGNWFKVEIRGPAATPLLLKLPDATRRDQVVQSLGALVKAAQQQAGVQATASPSVGVASS